MIPVEGMKLLTLPISGVVDKRMTGLDWTGLKTFPIDSFESEKEDRRENCGVCWREKLLEHSLGLIGFMYSKKFQKEGQYELIITIPIILLGTLPPQPISQTLFPIFPRVWFQDYLNPYPKYTSCWYWHIQHYYYTEDSRQHHFIQSSSFFYPIPLSWEKHFMFTPSPVLLLSTTKMQATEACVSVVCKHGHLVFGF